MFRALLLPCLALAGSCAEHPMERAIRENRIEVISPEHVFRPDPRPPSDRYIPIDIWENAGIAGFHERWFGGQLAAMGEPILSRPGDLREFRRRFRMLVLPSFHPAYAIRVDQRTDRVGEVTIVRLDGSGGHEQGAIGEQEGYAISAEATDAIFGDATSSGLAAAPAISPPCCTDGVGFVFELVQPDGYRFVNQHQGHLTEALEMFVWRIDALRRQVASDLGIYRGGPGKTLVRSPEPARDQEMRTASTRRFSPDEARRPGSGRSKP